MNALKKHWWKAVSAAILFAVTWFSFTVPLQSGIVSVVPEVKNKQLILKIQGYNTHFGDQRNFAWLSSPDKKDCIWMRGETVQSEKITEVYFRIPDTLSTASWHLYYSGEKDGAMFFPNVYYFQDMPVVKGLIHESAWPQEYILEQPGFHFPFQNILYETIRNLNFHVVMWMVTMLLLFFSLIYSIAFLLKEKMIADYRANALVETAMMFTVLGILTGMVWAKNTWGAYWVNDPKLNGAVVGALVYLAYIILRRSVKENEKRARLAAVYNVFAFVIYIVFIQVLPRFTDSLHPGNGGNPAFSSYDLDDSLRAVFYPAILGFLLLGLWICQLKVRLKRLDEKIDAHT